MNALVVGEFGDVFNELEPETYAQTDGLFREVRQRTIVVAATASQTLSGGSKAQSRDQHEIELRGLERPVPCGLLQL